VAWDSVPSIVFDVRRSTLFSTQRADYGIILPLNETFIEGDKKKMNIAPAMFSAQYEVIDSWRATVALRGQCCAQQKITVVHDTQMTIQDYRIDGDGCLPVVSLSSGDVLTFLVYDDDGAITACGVYVVRIVLAEIHGIILDPVSVSHLNLYQCDETLTRPGDRSIIEMYPELAEAEVL
jgi:hypothetical protein